MKLQCLMRGIDPLWNCCLMRGIDPLWNCGALCEELIHLVDLISEIAPLVKASKWSLLHCWSLSGELAPLEDKCNRTMTFSLTSLDHSIKTYALLVHFNPPSVPLVECQGNICARNDEGVLLGIHPHFLGSGQNCHKLCPTSVIKAYWRWKQRHNRCKRAPLVDLNITPWLIIIPSRCIIMWHMLFLLASASLPLDSTWLM